ncbi:hypothetical protein OI18_11720 [Flavihumibacter solisilvae]|uniref:Uncharacterized protein n=1 Tax=Flavihumibacter solisilvae TaxID=1349421 RepID=A0A0C1L2T0_9BACT|nr:hypothetical protein OI18_11720 [Flavihumibacter solisilvae]
MENDGRNERAVEFSFQVGGGAKMCHDGFTQGRVFFHQPLSGTISIVDRDTDTGKYFRNNCFAATDTPCYAYT